MDKAVRITRLLWIGLTYCILGQGVKQCVCVGGRGGILLGESPSRRTNKGLRIFTYLGLDLTGIPVDGEDVYWGSTTPPSHTHCNAKCPSKCCLWAGGGKGDPPCVKGSQSSLAGRREGGLTTNTPPVEVLHGTAGLTPQSTILFSHLRL